jgi:hypothetical protein
MAKKLMKFKKNIYYSISVVAFWRSGSAGGLDELFGLEELFQMTHLP